MSHRTTSIQRAVGLTAAAGVLAGVSGWAAAQASAPVPGPAPIPAVPAPQPAPSPSGAGVSVGEPAVIEGFGITIRPPAGWQRQEPPLGVLARFTPPKPNPDGQVLDLLLITNAEGVTPEQVRDRTVDFYRKSLAKANIAEPQPAQVAGQRGWDFRLTYQDAKGKPVTLVERMFIVGGNRVYSLRLAASGDKVAELSPVMDAVAALLKLDDSVTRAYDPAAFAMLAAKVKATKLTGLVPQEQYLLVEFAPPGSKEAPKPVGAVFQRFERAKFGGVEGWYLRVRVLQVGGQDEKGEQVRIRERAWAFVSDDWSRENWSSVLYREGGDGKSTIIQQEDGVRQGEKVTVRAQFPSAPDPKEREKSVEFTVPANYLPAAAEPAFVIMASREPAGDFAFSLHEPGQKTVDWVVRPRPPVAGADGKPVTVAERLAPGRTVAQKQQIDAAGRTVLVEVPESPTFRGVDKATLERAFPGLTKLD
jgi:hypothetical protein